MKKQTPEEIRKEQNKLILQRRKEAEALRQEIIRIREDMIIRNN